MDGQEKKNLNRDRARTRSNFPALPTSFPANFKNTLGQNMSLVSTTLFQELEVWDEFLDLAHHTCLFSSHMNIL